MPPNDPIDIIATQILFDAKSALANLKKFNEDIQDSGKKIANLKNIIQAVSAQMGGDLKGATAAVQKFANAFTGINPQLVKSIGKELKLLDDIAQKSLGGLSGKTMESSARMTLLSNAITQMAIKGKVSIAEVTRSLQMLNAAKGNQFQFGKLGFSQQQIAQAGQAANQSQVQLQQQIKKTGDAGQKAGSQMQTAFGKVVNMVNVMRIALGALISMLLFQAIQAVSTFFTEASNQAREMEETMYRIANAERILSESGQDISLKGLEDGITRIQKLLPIFAREDIAQLMGQIAIGTQQLGYSEDQIIDLAQAVALLNVQSVKSEDLLTTASHVMTALLGKSSTGVAALGISFNETEKQAAAMELQLLENGRTLQDLTDDELAAVKLQILMKNANVDSAEAMELLNSFLDSNSAKLQSNAAAWKDLQTTVGQFINNMLPDLVPAMEELQKSFELQGVQKLFASTVEGMEKFSLVNAAIFFKIATGVALTTKEYEKLKQSLSELDDKEILKIFPDPSAIKDRFTRELVQSIVEVKDTATGLPDPLIPDPVDEDALKALEELDDKLRDIALDAQHAREDLEVLLSQKQADLEVKFTQKRADIDTEYVRKEEDAAVDLQRKISDIERDAVRDRQKVLDKAREDEQKAEEDHQLKLWELKMRYLMDLEDALHARDARQIIRLQRQYELDKELLEKKKEQEDEERAESVQADLEDVEAKRKERLQDAQIEYEQKLSDLAIAKARELEELNVWKAREQADLAVWYQRELEEIDRQTQQKIERLLSGYIEEGKLHEEQQAAIHEIFKKYFGKNKELVDELVAYTAQAFGTMSGIAQNAFVQAGSLLAAMGAQVGSIASNPFAGGVPSYEQMVQNQGGGGGNRRAEGGTMLATRATTAVFGERGPELAEFTPLNRTGRDVNKLFGDSSMGGGEGTINLDILLSPDLEARIVENSMDGVANVLARINRSKV